MVCSLCINVSLVLVYLLDLLGLGDISFTLYDEDVIHMESFVRYIASCYKNNHKSNDLWIVYESNNDFPSKPKLERTVT